MDGIYSHTHTKHPKQMKSKETIKKIEEKKKKKEARSQVGWE